MVKKPEKVGGHKGATGDLCRGPRGEALSRRRQEGVEAAPPATESFCIFYPKK